MVMLFLTMVLATSCVNAVKFEQHSPYQVKAKIDKPLLLVVPDSTDVNFFPASTGKFLTRKKYNIYYAQAIKHETVARFQNMFSAINVVTESQFDEIQGIEPEVKAGNADEEKVEELDEFEAEQAELIKEIDFLPTIVHEQNGYVLHYKRILFTMRDLKPTYMVELEFWNRETGQVLLDGKLRASGQVTERREDQKLMNEQLVVSVTSACTNLLLNLRDNVAEVLKSSPEK